jgi:predicted ATPase/class 3 adenylate cyclase/DNA-binding CsgD family transcriptional regulator
VLPSGTVTLLLADVEASTRLWESDPEAMTAALARLDRLLAEVVERHAGARPVEQGEGDSFVIAFTRASDAVVCALELQRADLAPIKLRIGLHTGEVQLRDEDNYVGPTLNRCGRLRDLGHGGQTLVSQATYDLVVDRLPVGGSLVDLGAHRMRDLDLPERVHQLCHRDLVDEFPPLRSLDSYPHNLPVQLTRFIGRETELSELRQLLLDNRLVTLTGAGGAGKTRLALHLAADALLDHPDGAWQLDLAPINDPDMVATIVAQALRLPEDRGHSDVDAITHYLRKRRALVVLDNCEHLTEACAVLAEAVLRSCSSVTIIATSREPLGLAGEVSWRVPSLSLPNDSTSDSEAIELFRDRAVMARPSFTLNERNRGAVSEICRRLDGIPLAIELAAARVRMLSPDQIVRGLHDRFRLLTGGSRTAVQRQQTLRASVDWSYHLLSPPEQRVFRALAAFVGSFDLAAAEAVGSGDGLEAHHVFDQLSLLVDKSLVLSDDDGEEVRFRMLETIRQYGLDQLTESGEADATRRRHRDHYLAFAMEKFFAQPEVDRLALDAEMDNLRLAFTWSLDVDEPEPALLLASSLTALWLGRGRSAEGRAWLDAGLASVGEVGALTRAWALATSAYLEGAGLDSKGIPRGAESVSLAREVGDIILPWALLCAGVANVYFDPEAAEPLIREALDAAQRTGHDVVHVSGLFWLGSLLWTKGSVREGQACLERGVALAERTALPNAARPIRTVLCMTRHALGEYDGLDDLLERLCDDARQAEDLAWYSMACGYRAIVLAAQGEHVRALDLARECAGLAEDYPGFQTSATALWALTAASLAAGDVDAARAATEQALELGGDLRGLGEFMLDWRAEAILAAGDIEMARAHCDEVITRTASQRHLPIRGTSLRVRARVALVDADFELAADCAHSAAEVLHESGQRPALVDVLEIMAWLAGNSDSHRESARLFGAADAARRSMGLVRYRVYDEWYESSVTGVHAALGDDAFDAGWAEGAAMSVHEAVAYARRGRGERQRPSSGWGSLTPAELDVVRLVADGLANKEIGEKLFISPRTVQAHLTHVYAKLGVSSRMQLVKEAATRT